jgi:capsular polysaccharide biosynthesis protein
VPPEAFEYVRKSFLPMESSNRELPRRVYIDRRDASYRRIANGDEVERALARRGIVPMQLERLTFAEQVALFHRAEMIVAPHGAGLSNAVFCSPACRVLELFSPGYVNPVFWALSSLGQLVYAYLLGSGDSPPDGIDPHRVGDDIHVPVERLNNALDLLES